MEVFTYVGKRANALRISSDSNINISKSSLVRSRSEETIRPFKTFSNSSVKSFTGINGYSFDKVSSKKTVKSETKKIVNETKIVYRHSATYNLIFFISSLLIFASVGFSMFNFLNGLIDKSYLTKYVIDFQESKQVMNECSFSRLDEAMENFSLSDNQTFPIDALFDDSGNLLLADGTVLSSENLVIGEPVSYSTYTVKSGDTIGSITYGNGLRNISTLIAVNDIKNVRTIRSGQKLRIPSQDGLIHKVASGDSLNALSVKYHVSVEEILDTNDLTSDVLSIGMELFIPGARMDYLSLKSAMGELFVYPLPNGWRLTSHFGYRKEPVKGVGTNHTGIDMAISTGTPIYASMSGKVVKARRDNIYGNYVIIDHQNGYMTLYGHMSKILVTQGQVVSQKQRIGLVGSTGLSSGPHLHFTVYKNGKLVDPLTLLKK